MHQNRIKDISSNIVMPSIFTPLLCITSHHLLFVLQLFIFFNLTGKINIF